MFPSYIPAFREVLKGGIDLKSVNDSLVSLLGKVFHNAIYKVAMNSGVIRLWQYFDELTYINTIRSYFNKITKS